MAKQNKNIKATFGIRRRVAIYYARFINFIKITILLFVILLLFTNFLEVQKQKLFISFAKTLAEFGFVFEHLIIEGQRNIPSEDIMDAIGTNEGMPIYLLNLHDIRVRLEDNPWIRAALVERRLPNTLYVAIIERKPIAIWQFKQKLYLIDEDGARITSSNIGKFGDLIHVVGQDANIYARSLIEDLGHHPGLAKKVISAVRYGQRRWDLNLEQKINIKMPEKNFKEAYDYLDALNKKDKLFNQNYKTLNLKDPNKYYLERY